MTKDTKTKEIEVGENESANLVAANLFQYFIICIARTDVSDK